MNSLRAIYLILILFVIAAVAMLSSGGATFMTPKGQVFCNSVINTNDSNLYFTGCNDGNNYYLIIKEITDE